MSPFSILWGIGSTRAVTRDSAAKAKLVMHKQAELRTRPVFMF
jgi:hypothetical protein